MRLSRYRSVFLLVVSGFGMVRAGLEPSKDEILSRIVFQSLNTWHYHPRNVDDAFSKKAFALYLKRLDPQKRFLLRPDVDSLKRFDTRLDDELKQATHEFLDYAAAMQRRRIADAQTLVQKILAMPVNLNEEDSLAVDAEKETYCETRDELKARWTRLIKYQILAHMQDGVESGEKDKTSGKTEKPPKKSEADQETEAREYVTRSMRRFFERMLKEDGQQRLAVYLNTIGNVYDPHTEYFKPEAKEDFDLSMTGTLEGIGAVLREEDGYIKVVSIVPGSASWRQKELKAEDKILKVAQGRDEPVDLVDASVNDAVRLIRGRKGTEVRLTVQKPSGRIQVISIIRDVVVVEETYAKSAVVTPPAGNGRFGYVNLPAFYHDFNKADGRTASSDVRKELERLKRAQVDGIVLDFRSNGGGALEDAVKLAGLFFRTGPVVQIKDKNGAGQVLNDENSDVVYDGPLIILVNTFSASASEIVAAALQDYGRALILGADTSFGKGTVQTMLDLDSYLPPAFGSMRPMGSLKLTIQKFYRINGGSTQYQGVVPDILIPDTYSNLNVGEKSLEYALPWDTVEALSFSKWSKSRLDLAGLKRKSQARSKADPHFRQWGEMITRLQKQREREWVSIKKSRFFSEQESARKETEKYEALQKESASLSVTSPETGAKLPADSLEADKEKKWREQLSHDFYLNEAVNVLRDMNGR